MTILYRRSASVHPTNAVAPRRPKSADVSSQSRSSVGVRNQGPILIKSLRPRPRSAINFTDQGDQRCPLGGCHNVDGSEAGSTSRNGIVSGHVNSQILRNSMNLGPPPATGNLGDTENDSSCHTSKYHTIQPNVDSFEQKSIRSAAMGTRLQHGNGDSTVAPVIVERMNYVNEARSTAEDFFRAPTPCLRDEYTTFVAQMQPRKEPSLVPPSPRHGQDIHVFYPSESEVRTSDPVWCPQPRDGEAATSANLDAENFENERRYEGATWGMYYRIMKARANIPLPPARVQTPCKVIMSPKEIHIMEKSKNFCRNRNTEHSFRFCRDQTPSPEADDGVFAFDMDE